jgi:hypothetical protein
MKTKEGVDFNDLENMHPAAIFLLTQCDLICKHRNGFELIVTSLISDHPWRPPHSDGRAFDIGTSNMTELHIKRLVKKLNEKFARFGAIGIESGLRVTAIDEGDHIHVQVCEDAPLVDVLFLI